MNLILSVRESQPSFAVNVLAAVIGKRCGSYSSELKFGISDFLKLPIMEVCPSISKSSSVQEHFCSLRNEI